MLIETFPLLNGATTNAKWHAERMSRSAQSLGFSPIAWDDVWMKVSQAFEKSNGIPDQFYRCTILYDDSIREVRLVPYTVKEIRTLRIMEVGENFDYSMKYADRTLFNPFIERCAPHEEALLVRQGLLTDTTFTNIVLEYPDGRFLTPASPLLAGTQRSSLLEQGLILPAHLTTDNLEYCSCVHLINAMMPLHTLKVSVFIT